MALPRPTTVPCGADVVVEEEVLLAVELLRVKEGVVVLAEVVEVAVTVAVKVLVVDVFAVVVVVGVGVGVMVVVAGCVELVGATSMYKSIGSKPL